MNPPTQTEPPVPLPFDVMDGGTDTGPDTDGNTDAGGYDPLSNLEMNPPTQTEPPVTLPFGVLDGDADNNTGAAHGEDSDRFPGDGLEASDGNSIPNQLMSAAGIAAAGGLATSETGVGLAAGTAVAGTLALLAGAYVLGEAINEWGRDDGRDPLGRYANGNSGDAAREAEERGLDQVGEQLDADVLRDQVLAKVPGDTHGRRYDGLVENEDGTYIGIEIKSGTAQRSRQQREFDAKVSEDNPATATLNGETIEIVEVIEHRTVS